jgi:hypothetical protein
MNSAKGIPEEKSADEKAGDCFEEVTRARLSHRGLQSKRIVSSAPAEIKKSKLSYCNVTILWNRVDQNDDKYVLPALRLGTA